MGMREMFSRQTHLPVCLCSRCSCARTRASQLRHGSRTGADIVDVMRQRDGRTDQHDKVYAHGYSSYAIRLRFMYNEIYL